MAVRCMGQAYVPLARLAKYWSSYGCTLYGASLGTFGLADLILVGCALYSESVGTFGLANLVLVIVWLYAVWRERRYFGPS